ncbi:hypothetical protein KR222_008713 [Zaprionus bogoriensis]|nr:hypothetical protein KR222_008713 [Zaprionus bogoriensis]
MSAHRLTTHLLPLPLLLLLIATPALHAEPAGYHYDRPTRPQSGPSAPTGPSGPGGLTSLSGLPAALYTGHHFAPLPTVQPLPPAPALPPLPTPRVPLPRSRPLLPTSPAVGGSLLNRYLPSSAVPPPVGASAVSNFLPPTYGAPIASISFHGQPIRVPSGPAAAPQPLRVPYGKQAQLIAPGQSYVANGRQLKQYAVIELIDNDIDEQPAPFLSSAGAGSAPFFDRFRAHLGASGTGASGSGVQLDSRANALVLEQQALSVQPRFGGAGGGQAQSDAIALGSGGLGYIRLPNGNVYLGSGSLGYISGQQRVASVLDARTRSEATSDALHFGHGPLGGADNFLRFK